DISGFLTEYKDMIEFNFGIYTPDSVTIPTFDHVGFKALNTGMARITGFEISLTAEGQSGFLKTHGQIGYTYLNPVDLAISPNSSDTLNLLKYRFKHSFKTNLEFSRKKIKLGTTLIFRSKTERIDEIFIDPVVGNLLLPGFPEYWKDHQKAHWIVNARVGYKITRRGEFTIHGKNLLNKEYVIRPGDIGPPRNFSLQFSWDF
ncbi:MAG: TonB-dependent receptor, partial [Bacteroidales bacterium]|nr:TonB-dependent receptor [Bacteroidales bacterium]